MQQDGNIIQFDGNGKILMAWNTNTNLNAYAVLQGDGNLVAFDSGGKVITATNVASTC